MTDAHEPSGGLQINAGIHEGLPFDAYVAIRAMNQSTLKKAWTSARHLRHAMDTPSEPTAEQYLGTAFHARMLDDFASFVAAPVNKNTGKAYGFGTAKWNEAAAEVSGHEMMIGESDLERIVMMESAFLSDFDAVGCLRASTQRELSIVWDRGGAYRAKARLDGYKPGANGFIWDIKTTSTIAPDQLSRAMWSYGYDIQCAWYQGGVYALTGETLPFFMTFIESKAPFGCVTYEIAPEAIAIGRQRVALCWSRYVTGMQTGEWPMAEESEDLPLLYLPTWVHKQYDGASTKETTDEREPATVDG